MIKKLNEDGAITHIIIALFLSLLISSVLISWFLLQIYGSALGVTAITPLSKDMRYTNLQDFKTNQVNQTVLKYDNDEWEYIEGVGYTTKYRIGFDESDLLIDKIIPTNSRIVTNYYHINNSVHGFYSIVLKKLPVDLSGQNAVLYFNSWGINKQYYLSDIVVHSEVGIYYPDIYKIEDVTIKTVYYIDEGKCFITFNDITYEINDLPIPSGNQLLGGENILGVYYGGVLTSSTGFTISEFKTENNYSNENSIINSASDMLILMSEVIVWGIPNEVLPYELNILFIKTQVSALIIAIIAFMAGRD